MTDRLHTWPLASAPHRLSLNFNADAHLNTWIISLVALVLAAVGIATARSGGVGRPLVAEAPDPALLVEFPFFPPDVMHENGKYVLNPLATGGPSPMVTAA